LGGDFVQIGSTEDRLVIGSVEGPSAAVIVNSLADKEMAKVVLVG
jgi:hypothetical protein